MRVATTIKLDEESEQVLAVLARGRRIEAKLRQRASV
jgi:hypothetical protein